MQTILVSIASFSTLSMLIGTAIDGFIIYDASLDVVVNCICVWLMLDTSSRYWNICKRYGCCICCYLDSNKIGM